MVHPNSRLVQASRTTPRGVFTVLAVLLAAGTLAVLPARMAAAQTAPQKYPSKTVSLVVPYSPGGGTDILGRLFAKRLSEIWGQSVVVDNRTGANGAIGSNVVARAAADGHTLLLVVGSHAINPVLMKTMPYETDKAFTPITNIATSPSVLVVRAAGPYKSLPDLLAAGQKEQLGIGYSEGQTRLTGELIKQAGKLQTVGVPYKGAAPMLADIIGGHLPSGVTSVVSALPHVKSGALRVIGVADAKRTPTYPDAMTFAEAGLAGVESLNWYGLFGPAGLPAAIVEQINQDLKKAASDPEVAKPLESQGANLIFTPPAEFKRFLASELAKWKLVAERSNIQPE